MLKNKNIDLNDNNINEKPVFRHKKPIIYPDVPIIVIEPEKPIESAIKKIQKRLEKEKQ